MWYIIWEVFIFDMQYTIFSLFAYLFFATTDKFQKSFFRLHIIITVWFIWIKYRINTYSKKQYEFDMIKRKVYFLTFNFHLQFERPETYWNNDA